MTLNKGGLNVKRKERGMTIAIGVIATDGIVIATDREENDGYQKIEQGKMAGIVHTSTNDSLIVTGDGSGAYVDSISTLLRSKFAQYPQDIDKFALELQQHHKDFYTDYVLPFSNFSATERPEYSLIVGCQIGLQRKLWTSEYMVVNESTGYTAVGAGGAMAKSLLRRFYAYVPVVSAINLAVFVVNEVKRLTPGCGLETDVLCIREGHEIGRVVGDDVREIESALRVFEQLVDRGMFHECIGSDLSLDPRTKSHNAKPHIARLRKKFKKMDERRFQI